MRVHKNTRGAVAKTIMFRGERSKPAKGYYVGCLTVKKLSFLISNFLISNNVAKSFVGLSLYDYL